MRRAAPLPPPQFSVGRTHHHHHYNKLHPDIERERERRTRVGGPILRNNNGNGAYIVAKGGALAPGPAQAPEDFLGQSLCQGQRGVMVDYLRKAIEAGAAFRPRNPAAAPPGPGLGPLAPTFSQKPHLRPLKKKRRGLAAAGAKNLLGGGLEPTATRLSRAAPPIMPGTIKTTVGCDLAAAVNQEYHRTCFEGDRNFSAVGIGVEVDKFDMNYNYDYNAVQEYLAMLPIDVVGACAPAQTQFSNLGGLSRFMHKSHDDDNGNESGSNSGSSVGAQGQVDEGVGEEVRAKDAAKRQRKRRHKKPKQAVMPPWVQTYQRRAGQEHTSGDGRQVKELKPGVGVGLESDSESKSSRTASISSANLSALFKRMKNHGSVSEPQLQLLPVPASNSKLDLDDSSVAESSSIDTFTVVAGSSRKLPEPEVADGSRSTCQDDVDDDSSEEDLGTLFNFNFDKPLPSPEVYTHGLDYFLAEHRKECEEREREEFEFENSSDFELSRSRSPPPPARARRNLKIGAAKHRRLPKLNKAQNLILNSKLRSTLHPRTQVLITSLKIPTNLEMQMSSRLKKATKKKRAGGGKIRKLGRQQQEPARTQLSLINLRMREAHEIERNQMLGLGPQASASTPCNIGAQPKKPVSKKLTPEQRRIARALGPSSSVAQVLEMTRASILKKQQISANSKAMAYKMAALAAAAKKRFLLLNQSSSSRPLTTKAPTTATFRRKKRRAAAVIKNLKILNTATNPTLARTRRKRPSTAPPGFAATRDFRDFLGRGIFVPRGFQLVKNTQNTLSPISRVKTICLEGCRYDVVRRIALQIGFREVAENDVWNVIWTDVPISLDKALDMRRFQDAHSIFWGTAPPLQKANHFPGMNEICRKDRLARNLNRMRKSFPTEYDFFPKTWSLPADISDLLVHARVKKNSTYICKPDSGCQGRGIFLIRNLKKLNPFAKLICQVYIPRPYLIDGYKFDLRIYILITSCDPLHIYIYNEGIARFATVKYEPPSDGNVDVIFMHLTNYSLNKFSQSYAPDPEGSKRKLSSVLKWMEGEQLDTRKLLNDIDAVIVKTMIAAQPTLRHYYRASFPKHDRGCACFEILGFDILLDHRLKPFLLEVNHSPSFNLDLPVDAEIKEALLTDTFNKIYLGNVSLGHKGSSMRRMESPSSSLSLTDNAGHSVSKALEIQFQYEATHSGNFRLIYPSDNSLKYAHFFDQTACPTMVDAALLQRRREEMAAASAAAHAAAVAQQYGGFPAEEDSYVVTRRVDKNGVVSTSKKSKNVSYIRVAFDPNEPEVERAPGSPIKFGGGGADGSSGNFKKLRKASDYLKEARLQNILCPRGENGVREPLTILEGNPKRRPFLGGSGRSEVEGGAAHAHQANAHAQSCAAQRPPMAAMFENAMHNNELGLILASDFRTQTRVHRRKIARGILEQVQQNRGIPIDPKIQPQNLKNPAATVTAKMQRFKLSCPPRVEPPTIEARAQAHAQASNPYFFKYPTPGQDLASSLSPALSRRLCADAVEAGPDQSARAQHDTDTRSYLEKIMDKRHLQSKDYKQPMQAHFEGQSQQKMKSDIARVIEEVRTEAKIRAQRGPGGGLSLGAAAAAADKNHPKASFHLTGDKASLIEQWILDGQKETGTLASDFGAHLHLREAKGEGFLKCRRMDSRQRIGGMSKINEQEEAPLSEEATTVYQVFKKPGKSRRAQENEAKDERGHGHGFAQLYSRDDHDHERRQIQIQAQHHQQQIQMQVHHQHQHSNQRQIQNQRRQKFLEDAAQGHGYAQPRQAPPPSPATSFQDSVFGHAYAHARGASPMPRAQQPRAQNSTIYAHLAPTTHVGAPRGHHHHVGSGPGAGTIQNSNLCAYIGGPPAPTHRHFDRFSAGPTPHYKAALQNFAHIPAEGRPPHLRNRH